MSQYDFVANVIITIHNTFIDLVNKLLINKMSLAKTLIFFNAFIFVIEYADKKHNLSIYVVIINFFIII